MATPSSSRLGSPSEFGDKAADRYCHDLLAKLYPGRQIVQINIDPVAAGGGGIHCITLHQPA